MNRCSRPEKNGEEKETHEYFNTSSLLWHHEMKSSDLWPLRWREGRRVEATGFRTLECPANCCLWNVCWSNFTCWGWCWETAAHSSTSCFHDLIKQASIEISGLNIYDNLSFSDDESNWLSPYISIHRLYSCIYVSMFGHHRDAGSISETSAQFSGTTELTCRPAAVNSSGGWVGCSLTFPPTSKGRSNHDPSSTPFMFLCLGNARV